MSLVTKPLIVISGSQCCDECGIEETPPHLVDHVDDVIEIKLFDDGRRMVCGECDAELWSRIDRMEDAMKGYD